MVAINHDEETERLKYVRQRLAHIGTHISLARWQLIHTKNQTEAIQKLTELQEKLIELWNLLK